MSQRKLTSDECAALTCAANQNNNDEKYGRAFAVEYGGTSLLANPLPLVYRKFWQLRPEDCRSIVAIGYSDGRIDYVNDYMRDTILRHVQNLEDTRKA